MPQLDEMPRKVSRGYLIGDGEKSETIRPYDRHPLSNSLIGIIARIYITMSSHQYEPFGLHFSYNSSSFFPCAQAGAGNL